jgi:hypothetical protein
MSSAFVRILGRALCRSGLFVASQLYRNLDVQRCRGGWWTDDLYWIRGIERSFGPTIPNHLSARGACTSYRKRCKRHGENGMGEQAMVKRCGPTGRWVGSACPLSMTAASLSLARLKHCATSSPNRRASSRITHWRTPFCGALGAPRRQAVCGGRVAHPLTENFSVFGYHVTGSTGSLFLFGIVVGAVALLGLSVLLAGARRSVGRGRGARFQREMAFGNRARDTRLEHQQRADTGATPTVNSGEGAIPRQTTPRRRIPLLGRWSRVRQPISTRQSNGHRSVGPLSR